jgi:hypothetical protein
LLNLVAKLISVCNNITKCFMEKIGMISIAICDDEEFIIPEFAT